MPYETTIRVKNETFKTRATTISEGFKHLRVVKMADANERIGDELHDKITRLIDQLFRKKRGQRALQSIAITDGGVMAKFERY